MGPNRGVSSTSEHSSCLVTERQDQEAREEGEIEIGGAFFVRALRIAMRTAAPSMVSAVQTPGTATMPPTTSTTRSHSPQWKHRRGRRNFGHSAPRMNQSTPMGYSDISVASADKRLGTRSSCSRKNRPINWDSECTSLGVWRL